MKTKWPTDLHGELNEGKIRVLLENGVPKTTEKATSFGMKVFKVAPYGFVQLTTGFIESLESRVECSWPAINFSYSKVENNCF